MQRCETPRRPGSLTGRREGGERCVCREAPRLRLPEAVSASEVGSDT